MMAVIDNDIIFKGACYSLLSAFCKVPGAAPGDIGALSAARFVVEKKIKRAQLAGDVGVALGALGAFLDAAATLDPTADEEHLAAELEFAAQQLGVPLDTGESQLCAIVTTRAIPLLLTGDKRAIQAIEQLLASQAWLAALSGAVKCLEQLVLAAVRLAGAAAIAEKVCAERTIDKALTFCFSCHSKNVDAPSPLP